MELYDADLEHISIIPDELQFFPKEAQQHWEKDIFNAIYFYNYWPRAHKKKGHFLTVFTLAHLALESERLTEYAIDVARKLNMEQDANRFLNKINSCNGNKPLQIDALLATLSLAKRKFAIERYDEKLGFVPLPLATRRRYPSAKGRKYPAWRTG